MWNFEFYVMNKLEYTIKEPHVEFDDLLGLINTLVVAIRLP